MIVVTDIGLDREVMSIRTWWALDERLTANPLSVYLYFRALGSGAKRTQQEAARELGLGEHAFRTAKERLRRAGFLQEIRDRYPDGYRDPRTGEPKGGQNRYRLVFQDPAQGVEVPDSESLISSDSSIELATEIPDQNRSWKSRAATSSALDNQERIGKPQVSRARDFQERAEPVLENHDPLEEDTGLVGWLVNSSSQPTNQTGRTREATDAELESLAPGCGLTLSAIESEVAGRVDLSRVDVVQATRETLLRATTTVAKPAGYVAAVIVRKPDAWPVGREAPTPFVPTRQERAGDRPSSFWPNPSEASCARGVHDWGAEYLPEIERAHCIHCGEARRRHDARFAALEADFEMSGGGL
ncbi:hypothetical protein D3248_01620 [Leucobacter zeae]|nr:hypothetical protein [Leucobacter zeae]